MPLLGNFLNFYHPRYGRNPQYSVQTLEYAYRTHGKIVRVEIPFRSALREHILNWYIYKALGTRPMFSIAPNVCHISLSPIALDFICHIRNPTLRFALVNFCSVKGERRGYGSM